MNLPLPITLGLTTRSSGRSFACAQAERLTVRGNAVFLDHGAGVVSGYFHMSELAVETDQCVQAGDLLGKVGATGLVTGPHLHWELRVNGRWIDPGPWLTRVIP